MNDFTFYFGVGWEHIIGVGAADHILFIIALAAIYTVKDWKKVLILVTAFTIGHSLTLVLSIFDVLKVNSSWVEFLIPVTIITTAVFNVLQKPSDPAAGRLHYFLALFFGLIHGLGFANSIRFMLAKDQGIGAPLFAFNIGLEAGQVVIVSLILLCSFIFIGKMGIKQKWWILLLSAAAFSVALYMAATRIPF